MSGIKDVFGGATFWAKGEKLAEESKVKQVFDILVCISAKLECSN